MRNRVAPRVDRQAICVGNVRAIDHDAILLENHPISRNTVDTFEDRDDMARAGRRGLEVGSPEGKPGEVHGDAGGHEIASTNFLRGGEIEKIQTKRLGVGDVDHGR